MDQPKGPPIAPSVEMNLDGLVGPTHHYGGLSFGNVASTTSQSSESNPREAALQGLRKMKFLASLGLQQGVLPPQERPDLGWLRRLGYSGKDGEIVERVAREAPELLASVSSASSMWAANAATVSPSPDCEDGRLHLTPANLIGNFHRAIEPDQTRRTLQAIFKDPRFFAHHLPLPGSPIFGDEGAANHTRFCPEYGGAGVEFFVYGRSGFRSAEIGPTKFPARQSREASAAIARLHGLRAPRMVMARQNPEAIDLGVFHNDVASVGNLDFFLCHEQAFFEQPKVLDELRRAYRGLGHGELRVWEVSAALVPLVDAVKSYLFNSQVVSLPGRPGMMALIAPLECQEVPSVRGYLEQLSEDGRCPFEKIHFLDLKQSMRNGGGPACLRLRVAMKDEELGQVNPGPFLTDALYGKLVAWVERHYRDRLSPGDLGDPRLLVEGRAALDELTQMMALGSIYPFQLGQHG